MTCDKCGENYVLMNKWRDRFDTLMEAVAPLVEATNTIVRDWNDERIREKGKFSIPMHPLTNLVETAAKGLEESKK